MKIGEIIEVEGVKYIAQEEILACKGCWFEYPDNENCYDKFKCKSQDNIILVKIPLELLRKTEQLEKQVELMKNCDNCENVLFTWCGIECQASGSCVKNSKWELNK